VVAGRRIFKDYTGNRDSVAAKRMSQLELAAGFKQFFEGHGKTKFQ
jgi:hypothetical protein